MLDSDHRTSKNEIEKIGKIRRKTALIISRKKIRMKIKSVSGKENWLNRKPIFKIACVAKENTAEKNDTKY